MPASGGVPAESVGKDQCEQARDAFEECTKKAGELDDDEATEKALKICQRGADQAVKALEAAGG